MLCFIATHTGLCLRWWLIDGVSSQAGTMLLGPAETWPEEHAAQDLHSGSEGAAVTFRGSPRLHKVKTGPERPVGSHSPSFSTQTVSPSFSQMPACCPDHLRHRERAAQTPPSLPPATPVTGPAGCFPGLPAGSDFSAALVPLEASEQLPRLLSALSFQLEDWPGREGS